MNQIASNELHEPDMLPAKVWDYRYEICHYYIFPVSTTD